MVGLEAEMAIIGALLLDADTWAGQIFDGLNDEDFSEPKLKTAFKAGRDLFSAGKAIDLITMLEALGGEYRTTLMQCIDITPTTKSTLNYIAAVKTQSMRRRASDILQELALSVNNAELGECQTKAENLCAIFGNTESRKVVRPLDGLKNFFETKSKPKRYIRTGFSRLDKYTFIDLGDFIVLGGRPSSGKTAFALSLMTKISETHPTAFFSFETSAEKIMDRLMAATGIPLDKIKRQELSEEDWSKAAKATDPMMEKDFTIVEASGMTVAQIRAKVLQLKSKVIFIDYLGLIKADGKSLYEKVTNISIDLHNMAQQLKVAVFALAQLNRGGAGKEPDMTDLRESGQIEQDADLILMLHNPNPEEGSKERICSVVKNKDGETGKIAFDFYGATQNFYEQERRYG